MKVQVLGLGYIGLPTAATIASAGHTVYGYDISEYVIDSIQSGPLHIEEKGLHQLVEAQLESGHLSISKVIRAAEFHIICVPTPFMKGATEHEPDISFILAAIKSLVPVLSEGSTVILESTSPVGTTRKIAEFVKTLRPELSVAGVDSESPHVNFCYCPERIIPGDMLRELQENDRVIGGIDDQSTEKAFELYHSFVVGKCLKTSAGVAEMVKLTENSFRDVNIAFANELSIICDKQGLPVEEVIELANCHPRVNILSPGPGVGGHCIAVDPWFIVSADPENARLIHTARKVNDEKPDFVIDKVCTVAKNNPSLKIYCLGLTYKPNVDDFRESPALRIVTELTKRYGMERVIGVDPYLSSFRGDFQGNLNLVDHIEINDDYAIIVGLVHHSEFDHMVFPKGSLFMDYCGISTGQNNTAPLQSKRAVYIAK